ncbi:hypothetical protein [Nitratiruptor sp. YY09-18]|uniref:hypothetical protein n=1 Tax=Nitratiruptor sp. YY09-18 TaxID=2724901 RepID=UPI001914F82E|nr:hypothetical protein [Nitratiruptor sp. YY09-18]BCD67797.1 hypothetical protein NitYY0918_C0704 [Nitratiruptor sp. YY09-18]
MADISIKGAAKVIKLYNVSRLEMEGVEIDEFDLESAEDVKELFELVNEFVESGEADAIEPPLELQGVDPEECSIKVGDKTLYPDEITLKNANIIDLLQEIQDANEGEVYYIRSFEGDGVWDLESEEEIIDAQALSIDYVDCSILFDQYDLLREGYLDIICDTILPTNITYKGTKVEVEEFIFHPTQIYGQLYVVKKDPIEDINVLQKVDFGGRVLAGTDFIVDDFEEN